MAKYKAPTTEPEAPKRKTVVPGWARKYQREQEAEGEANEDHRNGGPSVPAVRGTEQ